MCMTIPNKELRTVADAWRAKGWTLEMIGKHPKLRSPGGTRCVLVSLSPSDRNAHRVLERALRRAEREEADEDVKTEDREDRKAEKPTARKLESRNTRRARSH